MALIQDHNPAINSGLRDLIERQERESVINRKQNVSWDAEKNYVYVVQGKIALKAAEDKIIVLLDKFKTGYECKLCGGDGLGRVCADCNGTGKNRLDGVCRSCSGIPDRFVDKDCPNCAGRGSSIIIPESSKALPTSGIIVSVGPKCEHRKVGQRVLFGAHVGYFLPFKGNIRLRTMREYEPLADIFMVDNNDERVLGDFLQFDEPVDNS